MNNENEVLGIFNNKIEEIIRGQLAEMDKRIRAISSDMPEPEIIKALKEANSLIKFVCGEDAELYEEWRYRFIKVGGEKKWYIIQGDEVDVDTQDEEI